METEPKQPEHTPEPWHQGGGDLKDNTLYDARSRLVGHLSRSGWLSDPEDYELALANARRIVACVNACAGVSIQILEKMVLGQIGMEWGDAN